jgi:alginate O-acetyltransferase complex protein AlgI
MHGGWLALERMSGSARPVEPRRIWVNGVWLWVRRILVFHGVCITWVFFRATSFHDAVAVLSHIAQWLPGASFITDFAFLKCLLTICLGIAYFAFVSRPVKRSIPLRWAMSTAAILLVILFGAESKEFIYFVF